MKRSFLWQAVCILSFALTCVAFSQINTGSNGSDGALNPTQSVVIDMSDHPDGIYQYTSVNIPNGVTVNFKPNSNNAPVTWLIQGDCIINGIIDASANTGLKPAGPGGGAGGNGGSANSPGVGPGGGQPGTFGGNGSYATVGGQYASPCGQQASPGAIYGNSFLVPLLGGSGGGGSNQYGNGAGGGGAILIAAPTTINLNGGQILASGGTGFAGLLYCTPGYYGGQGAGSGGAIRLVAQTITGTGNISSSGGSVIAYDQNDNPYTPSIAGQGRIRFDVYYNNFSGTLGGNFTQGFQPIIIPTPGQGIQLAITSIAGNAVRSSPSGTLANPDVIVPAQTTNPVPIVVSCTNVPVNSEIKVTVHPANGSDVQEIGLNNAGNSSSSTATVSLNLPTGGGIVYASAVTGINGASASNAAGKNASSYAKTGLTTNGERFAKIETKTSVGGKQQQTLITESGKRYPVPGN